MRLLTILLMLGLPFFMQAQTVTGNWYGLAEASGKGTNTNNYLTELVIKQNGKEVKGVFGYYFRSGYQSYIVKGTYDAKTRLLVIKNIPVTYFKSRDIDGIDCPMDFYATLFKSRVKTTLSGSFISQEKYKYTCPELKFSYSLDIDEEVEDSLIGRNTVNIRKYWRPSAEDLTINTKDISTTTIADRIVMGETKIAEAAKVAAVKKDSVADNKMPVAAPATDSAATAVKVPANIIAKDSVAAVATISKDSLDILAFKAAEAEKKKELEKLKVSFEKRKTVQNTIIEIESDSIRISFYDNGIVDGDSISIFINKFPVLTHQPLSEKALNMYLAMDDAHEDAEISMFAENLGKYPPNTALMVITDGSKRQEIFLSSSLSQNASVILKKKKR